MNMSNNDNILIQYEKVTNNAENINVCAKEMTTKLDNFNNLMISLKNNGILLGKSADTLEETFLRFRQNFDLYIKTVQDFSKMILYAGNSTRQTENMIKNDAQNLPK